MIKIGILKMELLYNYNVICNMMVIIFKRDIIFCEINSIYEVSQNSH